MNRALARILTALTICALAACSGGSLHPSLVPQQGMPAAQSDDMPPDALPGPASGDRPFTSADPVRRLCGASLDGERMACMAMARTDFTPEMTFSPDVNTQGEKCPFEGQGVYCPSDLQEAYDLPSLRKGKKTVVAIVDAFGYRSAASNLATYRKAMGLKPCTTSTKCLRILNQNGAPSPLPKEPPASDDWRGEESLDLDMASAICPNCRIVLIQSNNDETNNLYDGVKTAGRFSHYIGASWGGPEIGGNNPIFHQLGHIISVSAGDEGGGGVYGGGPAQPCTYTYVVCVGGTHLVRAHNSRGWSENVWNDLALRSCGGNCGATGSGCSTKIAKPGWQTDTQCRMRSEADVSATASLRAPVAVYNSEIGCQPPHCWWAFGGTSASAQIVSAVFALAGNAAGSNGASSIWKHHARNLNDVLKGNNVDPNIGVHCASLVKYICTARAGFDGPTGWGTPQGLGAF